MDGVTAIFEALSGHLLEYWEATVAYLAFDAARLLEPEMIVRLTLQVLLLLGSAFFSGSETALFSLSRLDLQQLRRARKPHSETLHALLDQPRRLIISILSGNELINIAAAANMTGILVSLYGDERAAVVAVVVMVPLLLLFGEVTPKTIAVADPVRISTRVVAGPMSGWVRLVTPLRWVIRGVADRITTLIVGSEKAPDNLLQVDEFKSLVEEVAKEGELNATERALIYTLLEAGDTEIVEIMTPRTRTAFLNADSPTADLVEQFKCHRHSRVPVFRYHRDNLMGFVHAEDILRLAFRGDDLAEVAVDELLRPPVVVPLTKKVDEMFDFFQSRNARAAVVLNEFGGVEGFVTMTDVLNFIFGHTTGEVSGQEHYRERDENVYEVPGEMRLTDFNTLTNFGIEDPRMTTIGGVAFRHLDRLPKEGDTVNVEGILITVLEMDAHRIAKVRVGRGEFVEGEDEAVAEPTPAPEEGDAPAAAPEGEPPPVAAEDTPPPETPAEPDNITALTPGQRQANR